MPRRPLTWPPIPPAPAIFPDRPPIPDQGAFAIRRLESGAGAGRRLPAAGALVELRRPGADIPAGHGRWVVAEQSHGGLDDAATGSAVRAPAPAESPEPAGGGRRCGTAGTGGDVPDPVRKRWLRQTALPVVAAGLASFVVGTGYLAVTGRPTGSSLGRWAAQATAAPVTVDGRGAGDPFGTVAVGVTGAPSRLRVKAIGLDTPLENLHLGPTGALVPPRVSGEAGWYSGGTAPGDVGPAVIAGHVDSKSGPAVFYRLRELTVGDRIEVSRGGTVLPFFVTRTAWYPKTRFPTGEVYGPTPDRQLRLITCGGVFDHRLRSYKDNLVVYAEAG